MKQKAREMAAVRTSEKMTAETKDLEENCSCHQPLPCATLYPISMRTSLSNGEDIRSRKIFPVLPVAVELSPELVPVLSRGKSARAGDAIVVVSLSLT